MIASRLFRYFAAFCLFSAGFLLSHWLESSSQIVIESDISVNETLPGYNIAIVIICEAYPADLYTLAIESVKCYAQIHGYSLLILKTADYTAKCPHKDLYFKRHCVVSLILPNYDYILFIDADVGVVNPNRKIEEFIDPSFDVTFYDRMWNWEIMAGGYILKNTNYSLDFITGFANYEFQLPKSYHGTDNGAIHMYIAEKLFPDRPEVYKTCRDLYNISSNLTDLFIYEACIRAVLGSWENYPPHIRILRKATGWARDSWLTNSVWDPRRDFMLHAWKTPHLKNYTAKELPIRPVENPGILYNPFRGSFVLDKCVPGNTTWNYDPNLISTTGEVQKVLDKYQGYVLKKYYVILGDIWKRLKFVVYF